MILLMTFHGNSTNNSSCNISVTLIVLKRASREARIYYICLTNELQLEK